MLALGCFGIILIWLLFGLINGAAVYAIWNWIIALILPLPHISWTWSFGIGLMLALFSTNIKKNN